jgi:hypothetical protein
MQTDRREPNAGSRSKSHELRIGLLSLLAAAVFLLSSVASADIVLLVGPDGAALPVGTYRLVTIPAKADQPVSEVKIVVGISPVSPVVVPPVIVPEPPVVPDPIDPPLPQKVTAAIYVYEKDQTSPPRPVQSAIDRLNAGGSGIVGSLFEQDSTTGTGTVPAQYREALTAARAAGLPVLVVMSGQTVLRVVKDPQTAEQIAEAVK